MIVFVIFMLLKREDLRDRFIRLAGSRDLPRTTQALDDAARRVGRYLLMQLVVNVTYAIPIGIGLWLIGIPNPVLWGMLCGLLRFVPYIGPIVAAFFPLALAIAVDPGWMTVPPRGRLVHRRRADQQQRRRAVALWREHRPLADRDHRGGSILDMALGADRPASLHAADRLPRGSRTACAAASVPRRDPRQRAGARAARSFSISGSWSGIRTRRPSAQRNIFGKARSLASTTTLRSRLSPSRSKTALRDVFPKSSASASTVEYAEAMKAGARFPALKVFHDGKRHYLADGFHRHYAAVNAGLREFDCLIEQGTLRDAILYACQANALHGRRRSDDDKRRAVTTLLNDQEWGAWSDREIARRCAVAHSFVARVRAEAEPVYLDSNPDSGRKVSRGGGEPYTMKTGSIGKRQAPQDTVPEHEKESF